MAQPVLKMLAVASRGRVGQATQGTGVRRSTSPHCHVHCPDCGLDAWVSVSTCEEGQRGLGRAVPLELLLEALANHAFEQHLNDPTTPVNCSCGNPGRVEHPDYQQHLLEVVLAALDGEVG